MTRGILNMFVGAMLAAVPALSSAEEAVPPSTQPTTQPTTQPVSKASPQMEGAMSLLRQAKDPSGAVDAYSAGLTIDPGYLDLKKLYVQKMVELENPEAATSQAHQVLTVDPNHAMSLAVVSHDNARRGNVAEGLKLIVRAGRQAPDVFFIQRGAAQMLAWYDNQSPRPTLDQATRLGIEDLRRAMANRQAFADAYKEANDFYRNAAANAQPQQPAQPQQAAQPRQPVAASDTGGGYTRYTDVDYVPTSSYRTYPEPYYYYNPYPYYYYTPTTVIYLDNCHSHFNHHHHNKWHSGSTSSIHGACADGSRTSLLNTRGIATSNAVQPVGSRRLATWQRQLPGVNRPVITPMNRPVAAQNLPVQPRVNLGRPTPAPTTPGRVSTPAQLPAAAPRMSAPQQRWNAPRAPGPTFQRSATLGSTGATSGRSSR